MNIKKLVVISTIVSIVVSSIVLFVGIGLVGNQSADVFGAIGITRFPNSGIAARGGYFSTSMPSSITDGTLTVTGVTTLSGATTTISGFSCIKIAQIGTTTAFYAYASTTSNAVGYRPLWATSTKPSYCP